jgi:hypothetical protein
MLGPADAAERHCVCEDHMPLVANQPDITHMTPAEGRRERGLNPALLVRALGAIVCIGRT